MSELAKQKYPNLKEKKNQSCREYYAKNKAKRSAYNKEYQAENFEVQSLKRKQRYLSRMALADSLKTPCLKCGEARKYLIQYHHIDPATKAFQIGTNVKRPDDVVMAEVAKCVCLCANCHKEFHHFYGNKPKFPVESLQEYIWMGGEENA